jgi:hypothetical protein
VSTFKIGDRVKVVNDTLVPEYNGLTGVVSAVDDTATWPGALAIKVGFDESAAERPNLMADHFAPDELELIPGDYDTSVAGVLRTAIANLDPRVDEAQTAVTQAYAALTAAQDKRDDLVDRRDALTRALTAVQEPTP